ncbi:MAG: glycosyltransferase family 2 protein [Patescibacteria group bacterium]|nr:glycosyltransferase family 2 protein [Patescibacteria group bacterium]
MIKVSVIVANHWPKYQFPKAGKESWLEVIVVNGTNPSWARNQGAKKAKGKYLVFLDNDTLVKKGWLDKVVKFMDQHPKVGAGQLKLLRVGSNKYDSAGDLITSSGFLAERAREAEDKGQFDMADKIFSGKGAAMLVRKDVFAKIGGFDESYVYYWEEPDLFWRVWQSGYEVRFLWMGTVYHAYGTKFKPIPKIPAEKQVYLACRNHLITILKNGTGWLKWRMLFWVSLSWLGLETMFVIKGKWKQAWSIERAWWWILFRSGSSCRSGTESNKWLKQVMIKRDIKWYLGKGISYVSGKPF